MSNTSILKLNKIYQDCIASGSASYYSGPDFDYYVIGGRHEGCGCSGGLHGASYYRIDKATGQPIGQTSDKNPDLTGFKQEYTNTIQEVCDILSLKLF